jgi:hypothetical protein
MKRNPMSLPIWMFDWVLDLRKREICYKLNPSFYPNPHSTTQVEPICEFHEIWDLFGYQENKGKMRESEDTGLQKRSF